MERSGCLWELMGLVKSEMTVKMMLIHDVQQNYSLSGALSPLSKVIICFVMLRGRHRGEYISPFN